MFEIITLDHKQFEIMILQDKKQQFAIYETYTLYNKQITLFML